MFLLQRNVAAATMATGILHTKNYRNFTIKYDDGTQKEFENPAQAFGCFPGDRVEWKDEKCQLVEHDSRWSMPISGILALASKTTYGLTKRGHPLFLFHPINKALPTFIVGSSEKDRTMNQFAIVQVGKWEASSEFPRGELVRLLGKVGTEEAEVAALQTDAFPWPSLRKRVVDVPPLVIGESTESRYRVRGFTFNIDPAGCKDIDDCVSFAHNDDGTYEVAITIADVASRIDELGALDTLAATFGQTLYNNGEAVCPMLPPSISESACSLLSGEERLGLSLILQWDRMNAKITDRKWRESIIRNDATFTYEDFTRADPDIQNCLREFCELLGAQSDGGDTHKWIEALMLEYNRRAGELLASAGVGILRRHSEANAEKLGNLAPLGLGLLAQQSAEYCLVGEKNVRHWGIGADHYAHASSPLRRYADLMNQRLMKQIVRGNMSGLMVTVDVADLNVRNRTSKQFEKRVHLIRALIEAKGKNIVWSGVVIGENRVWIEDLRHSLRVNGCASDAIGTKINVEIGLNLQGVRWSDRIVRRIIS